MQFGQFTRRLASKIRNFGRNFHFPGRTKKSNATNNAAKKPRSFRFWLIRGGIIFVILLWPVIAVLTSRINDQTDVALDVPKGGSVAVATIIYLVEREVNQTGWVPNAPVFMPAAMLNNMPNYQIGMIKALGRFSFELEDQVGRERGSSAADPDLEIARARLQYEPTVWIFKPGTLWPTAPAEDQYRDAVAALKRYNTRLAAGNATFDTRPDNLMAVLDRIALDIGAMSAELDAQIDNRHKTLGLLDLKADKIFYRVKGSAYAYLMLLQAVQTDFAAVIEDRQSGRMYKEMLSELRRAASMRPLVVNNGNLSGQAFANHLANQGFHLLRARTKMREITDILRK